MHLQGGELLWNLCIVVQKLLPDLTERTCTQELETIMDDDEDMADLYLTVSTFLQRDAEKKCLHSWTCYRTLIL